MFGTASLLKEVMYTEPNLEIDSANRTKYRMNNETFITERLKIEILTHISAIVNLKILKFATLRTFCSIYLENNSFGPFFIVFFKQIKFSMEFSWFTVRIVYTVYCVLCILFTLSFDYSVIQFIKAVTLS